MDEGFLRVQATAGQKGVSGADQGGVSERRADVEVIVPLQEGTVNDTENVPLIGIPVFIRQTGGDPFQLFRKSVPTWNFKAALQRRGNGGTVFLPILPKVRTAGVFPAAGVGYIKHVADFCLVSTGVNERDSPAAPADVTPHGPVPEVIFGAGRGVRPLGIDQELLMIGVLVQPSGGGEKGRPLLQAPGELPSSILREPGVLLCLICHPVPPGRSPGSGPEQQIQHRSCPPA